MLYSYRRLNLLENSIIEHGKILQTFISMHTTNEANKHEKNGSVLISVS